MATGIEGKILETLYAHLKSLTLTPALQIALPDIDFPAGGDAKPENYLEVEFIPNRTEQVTMGSEPQQHRGIFQVTVLWKSGDGVIKALDVAGDIIAHFKDQKLHSVDGSVTVTVDRPPWASPKIPDGDRTRWPVSVRYYAFGQEG